MTTPAEGTATPAPNPTNPPVPPPAAAVAQANPNAAPPDEGAAWLKERLARAEEQARQKILDDLGVKDTKKAKADLEAAEKAREEAKTVADKLTDTSSKLTRTESEAERLRKITAEWAGRQMIGLTTEQQEAVKAIAGEDPAEQLRAITALAPTWAKQTSAPTATPPLPTPASGTAPPRNAPEGTSVSPPNHKEVHAALLKQNPFAAAQYALEHVRDVFPEQTS